MNIVKDYRNFALSKGLGSSQIDSQEKQQVSNLAGTPMILEERQMNVAPFDVFSRLMYDRIIFFLFIIYEFFPLLNQLVE